ncbi:hypothetical protein [Pseudooceanicola antarcticus]|uniref:Uncharacterized protein n=1 Tax=Pseudooceanicola antarcticus TaxID=1247613 RepID=A0ABX4MI99_9RHOB|nr:hypothetical protein [Pseudooceanicola antarcticus]PJE25759.1 hypothetical protein CVM39_18820 [Pseudooceanicola antarcticus]
MTAELLDAAQAGLSLITAAGVGGIWFRLGMALAKTESLERRMSAAEERLATIENERKFHAQSHVAA